MKVLILNGSPRVGGNCSQLIDEMVKVFTSLDVESEIINVGSMNVRGCMACGYCHEHDGCVLNDEVNKVNKVFAESDGLVIVSPVYFGSPNGNLISFLDRLYYSRHHDLRFKVGAAFAVARRGGTTATFDMLNKYFTIAGMPVVSGDYWNNGFGREKGEIQEDLEGLRNARIVAKRMVFLMNAIKEEKTRHPELLEDEVKVPTHFIKNK